MEWLIKEYPIFDQRSEGFFYLDDRATAIRTAILQAKPGDGVLIARKGHEDYQILGTEKIHFDDREQSKAALLERLA